MGVAATVAWLAAACLADPQRTQSLGLLDQLITANAQIAAQPLLSDNACTVVGDVQSRLTGEPGLVDVRRAWSGLHAAAWALQAVCGQATLLRQPSTDSLAARQGRQRWELGIQRELSVACDHLREAAEALDRSPPC